MILKFYREDNCANELRKVGAGQSHLSVNFEEQIWFESESDTFEMHKNLVDHKEAKKSTRM